jgi:hypothetical protein
MRCRDGKVTADTTYRLCRRKLYPSSVLSSRQGEFFARTGRPAPCQSMFGKMKPCLDSEGSSPARPPNPV